MRGVRAAMVLAVALAGACRGREPECFRIKSMQGATPSPGGAVRRIFEAFVLANPPRDAEPLQRAVEKSCGKPPVPDAPAYSVQWWVFKETRETPRNLAVATGSQDDLDRHRHDLILDLTWLRTECGDYRNAFVYRDGELVVKTMDRLPLPQDAGPLPAACRKPQ